MADNFLITGYWGEPHITAENDRGINAAIFGTGRFVLPVGEQFRAEYIGNNTIRMYDGKLLDNGAAAGIPAGEYIDLLIANAGQGKKRNDFIVFQYAKDGASLTESGKFVVRQGTETSGTPSDPALEQQDLLSNEATIDNFALWRVSVSGTAVSAPVKLFSVQSSISRVASDKSDLDHVHDDRYYTESEIDSKLSTKSDKTHSHSEYATTSAMNTALSRKSDSTHTHDDRYYTETEVNNLLTGKSNVNHAHDDRYYTESEVNNLLSGKSNTNHTHDDRYNTKSEITDMMLETVAGVMEVCDTKSDKTHTHDDKYSKKDHTHDDRYNTKTEITNMMLETVAGVMEVCDTKSNTDHQHWYLKPQGGGNTVLVTNGGNLYPMVHEGQQLGTTTNRWSYILGKYVVGSAEVNGPVVNATTQVNSPLFNNTSDERLKENFNADMDKYVAMLDLLEPTSYLFKSEAEKEDRKRNVGYIAQRVQDAMAEVGLEDTDFGGLCYDNERESKGEYSYGLAYSQFIPILHAKIKQLEERYNAKIAEYDKKIAEIEAKLQ